MFEVVLREAGLSPNEARVFESMLPLGETSVQTIATKSGVHRRNVYDALTSLVEKGLVAQYVLKGEKQFRAADPKRLGIILQERQDRLGAQLPEMLKRYQTQKHEEQAYIYRGVAGFRNYMQDILDVGEDFYCIGAKGAWYDPRLRAYRLRFTREFRKKKLKSYHLFDWEMRHHLKQEIESPIKEHSENARFLPPECSTNSAIDFFGDRIVTFTGIGINQLGDDMVEFVLISRKLCESYKKWFWLLWEKSIPFDKVKEAERKYEQ